MIQFYSLLNCNKIVFCRMTGIVIVVPSSERFKRSLDKHSDVHSPCNQ